MTSERRFERDLPGLLDDLYLGPMPAYRDQVLEETGRTRQRPAWTFVTRWLPIVDLGRQSLAVAPIPLRSIGLIVLLAGIAVAMLAALIAASQQRLPAPFGLARSGLVAYSANGDIFTADPVTGAATALISGPETDFDPRWSRDGSRIAFRRIVRAAGSSQLYIARADGSGLTLVTPEPVLLIGTYTTGGIAYEFSPDGSEILMTASRRGIAIILVAKTDGSGIREIKVGRPATQAVWRPPNGTEILFQDDSNGGLYAVDARTDEVRTIIKPVFGRYRDLASWSPDGSQIAYMEWVDSNTGAITSRVHVVTADGVVDRVLPMPADAVWEVFRSWSNDGTKLLAIRGYTHAWDASVPVVVPVDGSGFGVEIGDRGVLDGNCCSVWEWAPDDTVILGTPAGGQGQHLDQLLLDPLAGTSAAVPWTTASRPTWQRLAP